jgi:hypothetical protein
MTTSAMPQLSLVSHLSLPSYADVKSAVNPSTITAALAGGASAVSTTSNGGGSPVSGKRERKKEKPDSSGKKRPTKGSKKRNMELLKQIIDAEKSESTRVLSNSCTSPGEGDSVYETARTYVTMNATFQKPLVIKPITPRVITLIYFQEAHTDCRSS